MSEKMNIRDLLKPILVPIHREAWVFVFAFAGITILLFLLHDILGYIGIILTLWCIFFFRDPKRMTPFIANAIISPADGVVQKISVANPPPEVDNDTTNLRRISIFMNVFNVHINRIPIDGKVTDLHYREGKFLSADLDKASEDNERQSITIKTDSGDQITIVQIAGLVARRIVCRLRSDDEVEAGERFGLIRFGSRVDVYVPPNYDILCAEGQNMIGGETVIARLASDLASDDNQQDGENMTAAEKGFIKNYN